jgi:hypothetical protein
MSWPLSLTRWKTHSPETKNKPNKRKNVKRTALLIIASIALLNASAFAGRKSMVPGSNDGYYIGGHGSSHLGGHYYNPKTGNDYRDRAHGVPYSEE